jgi:hypothetical protein
MKKVKYIMVAVLCACLLTAFCQSYKQSYKTEKAGAYFSSYYNMGGGHWVMKNIDSGKYIKLEDGSLWEIYGADMIYTMLWLTMEDITVAESDNPFYPYKLINSDSGDAADAKLIS